MVSPHLLTFTNEGRVKEARAQKKTSSEGFVFVRAQIYHHQLTQQIRDLQLSLYALLSQLSRR